MPEHQSMKGVFSSYTIKSLVFLARLLGLTSAQVNSAPPPPPEDGPTPTIGVDQPPATVQIPGAAVITLAVGVDTTQLATADERGVFTIGTETLSPGGTAIRIDGTAWRIARSDCAVVIDGQTSRITAGAGGGPADVATLRFCERFDNNVPAPNTRTRLATDTVTAVDSFTQTFSASSSDTASASAVIATATPTEIPESESITTSTASATTSDEDATSTAGSASTSTTQTADNIAATQGFGVMIGVTGAGVLLSYIFM